MLIFDDARLRLTCCLCITLAASAFAAEPLPTSVKVARSPDRQLEAKPTRTLATLPAIAADPKATRYGGAPGKAIANATGFFRVEKIKGRWWLIDPEGHAYIHRAVTSVRKIRTDGAEKALRKKFTDTRSWAEQTAAQLHAHHFNGTGAFTRDEDVRPAQHKLAYTKTWSFMAAYGKKRGGTRQDAGHRGYPGDCPFIFDPEFPAFCMERAKRLTETKDDPWLLGHFTDNELPWSLEMLERYLKLPKSDPGHIAAKTWLDKRASKKITAKAKEEFLAHAADTYFRAVTTAILKHDPNHLILGPRFHGRCLRIPTLFETASKHLDVIGINYYHAWTPDPERMAMWENSAKKPFLITEFYAKAADSGLGNTSGAGWFVKTQADRAAFYQNFTLGLLESRACVGWHWFRYSDNDPKENRDPSNIDANKGIVTNRYEPYTVLLDAMAEINARAHGIITHFDKTSR